MEKDDLIAIIDATIFTGEAFIEGQALLVQNDRISDIVPSSQIPPATRCFSRKNQTVVPGFIDCQINGGGNLLLNATPTKDAALAIAAAHRRYGTTKLLPTCTTDSFEVMQKCLNAVHEARKVDPSILGIHFEGPHLSQGVKGKGGAAHLAQWVRPLGENELGLYRPQGDEVILVTVAPETVPPEDIQKIRKAGAIVSLGHSEATSEQTQAALKAGANGFTHLYNTMLTIADGRTPNILGAALADQESYAGLIADGHHIADELLHLAIRAKPKHIYLVSDAMPPAATEEPKPYIMNGNRIEAKSGCCVGPTGRIAGSSIVLADAVRYCVQKLGIDFGEALRMASLYPARFLGLEKDYGKIQQGFVANLTFLDPDLQPITE
jgi:N-acetylglucosamine-6-phosphate deacetylase